MNENNKLEIIDTESEELALPDSQSLAAFDNRQKLLDHALSIGLKATSFGDWQDYGGTPYLQGSGAEKMLPKLPGFQITGVERTREDFEDKKGPFYVYSCKGLAVFYTSKIEVFGQCSSRYHVSAKRKEGTLPMEDINVTDVMSDAYSDMVRNAITRLFGLRNLEWDALEKFGIYKGNRTSLKSKKEEAPKNIESAPREELPPPEEKKESYWKWENKEGKTLIFANPGELLTEHFLKGCGMKKSKKGSFYADSSANLEAMLKAALEVR